jgi:hypothetical protein
MMFREFPRADTLRSKRNLKRKVRRVIRRLNKGLREDVFGDRFSVHIIQSNIVPWQDNSGWDANFLIEFRDAAQPERNYAYWFSPHFIIYSGILAGGRHVDSDLNDFIIRSDFWEKYRANK